MFDKDGLVSKQRTDLNKYVQPFATDRTDIHTLKEAMVGADVFLGLSVGNIVSQEMIKSMAKDAIVFISNKAANDTLIDLQHVISPDGMPAGLPG